MLETSTSNQLDASRTILLVDDEPMVRQATYRMLTSEQFRVFPACHGQEALNIWGESSEEIDLVLTDIHMPDMSGIDLAQKLTRSAKPVNVLYISGFPDLIAEANHIPASQFLQKPFTATDLKNKVLAAINAPLHNWTCPDCSGTLYRGIKSVNNGHTVTVTFACGDCGVEHVKIAESLQSHSQCPLCAGSVLLSGYSFVGKGGSFYMGGRCQGCATKVDRHSPGCPSIPW
jgi:CheY-like chemotaxis protein